MRRDQKLTRSSQFAAVFKQGKAWPDRFMVLRAAPNGSGVSRFGFIVSKKVGKKAVVRNKVKRRLREVMRLTPVEPGWDIMIIARSPAAEARYSDIQSSAVALLTRAKLMGRG